MTVPHVPPFISINGDKLLNEVREWWSTYLLPLTAGDLELLTVWTAHTHLIDVMYTTPRLVLDSPVPGAGKTTCLEHLHHLGRNPVTVASLSSPALLTRMLDVDIRTILIDEADRSLNPDKEGIADLLAVINSGYKRGATRPVLVPGQGGQWAIKEMPTFAPVAMAGNNPNLPEDTQSRAIRVLLLPDLEGAIEETDWELIEVDAYALQQQLVDWADQVRDQVKFDRSPLPEGITGRFREKWAPLRRVAVAAGGSWPDAIDELALLDRKEHDMDKEDGLIQQRPQVLLLTHIHETWRPDVPFLPTEDLINLLAMRHPEAWGSSSSHGRKLTAQRLGRMLSRAYKIHSGREDRLGPRGYYRAAFTQAWRQMRIDPPPK